MPVSTCESIIADENLIALLLLEDDMKRDLDFMREFLARLESSDEWQHHLLSSQQRPKKVDPKEAYHVMLLRDEGLLNDMGGGIFRMTSRGHDFLDHTRDSGIWEASKSAVSHLKDHSIGILMDVAKGYVRAKLVEMGVPIG